MSGLARLCKLYGGIDVVGKDGKKVRYIWDYVDDKAVPELEMTPERRKESEKIKWEGMKNG